MFRRPGGDGKGRFYGRRDGRSRSEVFHINTLRCGMGLVHRLLMAVGGHRHTNRKLEARSFIWRRLEVLIPVWEVLRFRFI